MNLLNDLEPGTEDAIQVIIEIPKGSKNKYEIDKKTGLIALDRAMHTSQDYPFDYGFVPQTLWDDDDALDVIVLSTYPISSGVLVRVRPVAIMEMIDSGDADDKLIAVPVEDPRWEGVKNLSTINPHTLKEIEHFFDTYKQIQKKEIQIKGFKDVDEAKKAFLRGVDLYKKAKNN